MCIYNFIDVVKLSSRGLYQLVFIPTHLESECFPVPLLIQCIRGFLLCTKSINRKLDIPIQFLVTALFRYNWYTKKGTCLRHVFQWVWTYASSHDTIITIEVITVFSSSQSLLVCVCVVITLNIRSTHLTNFEVHKTMLLTTGPVLYSRWSCPTCKKFSYAVRI